MDNAALNARLCDCSLSLGWRLYAMPALAGASQGLVQTPPLALSVHFAQGAAPNQEFDEPMETRVLPHQVPVKPTGLIILAEALLFPRWLRRASSPIKSMGTPNDRRVTADKL